MIGRAVPLAIGLTLAFATPVLARPVDPDRAPYTPPSPDPAPYIAPSPSPIELAPPPGIYFVTDTYVANLVTVNGPLTMYSTATVHESPGSYARVLDTVGTGEPSPYDGAAFNGRGVLRDGRAIAGTYYQIYVLTPSGFVPVSIVFFQDDAELARSEAASAAPRATATPRPSATMSTTATPSPCCAARASAPPPRSAPTAPPPAPIRPVISLLPTADALARIEVLRGRPVALWLRAFVAEREVPVSRWRLVSGEAGDADATSADGTQPFRTAWPRLAPPDSSFVLEFEIAVNGHRSAIVPLAVTVRAPALIE